MNYEAIRKYIYLYFYCEKWANYISLYVGAIFILRKDIGVGGPEIGNFPLLCLVKMSLSRWVGVRPLK